jgi:hypothetical protein
MKLAAIDGFPLPLDRAKAQKMQAGRQAGRHER